MAKLVYRENQENPLEKVLPLTSQNPEENIPKANLEY